MLCGLVDMLIVSILVIWNVLIVCMEIVMRFFRMGCICVEGLVI